MSEVKLIREEMPKCHFTYMEVHASDYEEWFQCKHCGHTTLIYIQPGER